MLVGGRSGKPVETTYHPQGGSSLVCTTTPSTYRPTARCPSPPSEIMQASRARRTPSAAGPSTHIHQTKFVAISEAKRRVSCRKVESPSDPVPPPVLHSLHRGGMPVLLLMGEAGCVTPREKFHSTRVGDVCLDWVAIEL